MRRTLAIVLIGVCACAAAPARAQAPGARSAFAGLVTFDQLFAAYDVGHYDVVANTLRTVDDLKWFNTTLKKALPGKDSAGKPLSWTRRRAAFLLEIAVVASTHPTSDIDVIALISTGRLTVTGRPWPPGVDKKEDAFETLWHRIAMGVLQRKISPATEAVYLDTVDGRFSRFKTPPDPWLVLDHVIASEQLAWVEEYAGLSRSTRLTMMPKSGGNARVTTLLQLALKSTDAAMTFPDVAIETGIRRAEILLKLGRADEALAATREVNVRDADLVQQYWTALLQARALHELHRLPEAERLYRTAMNLWPDASSPGTGLALVLFDMNRREEAMAAAEAVRKLPTDGADPWWSYQLGGARYINSWLDDLRGLIP